MNVSIFEHIIFRMCRFFDTLFGNVSIFRQAQTYIRENNIEENIFNRRVRARKLQIKSKVFSYSSESYFQLCVSNKNIFPGLLIILIETIIQVYQDNLRQFIY